ncbi:hypothetical protein LR48_Vigan07g117800 [Vigna angularis]|uniref:Uncharacterized protein n=1 Tax=Phaseolus angularis TaxID=3914 RepID=A0A0L9UY69_PHAAN|nr:hypothetical protein LR48_Vigan07g117800 [Vigna angularis]
MVKAIEIWDGEEKYDGKSMPDYTKLRGWSPVMNELLPTYGVDLSTLASLTQHEGTGKPQQVLLQNCITAWNIQPKAMKFANYVKFLQLDLSNCYLLFITISIIHSVDIYGFRMIWLYIICYWNDVHNLQSPLITLYHIPFNLLPPLETVVTEMVDRAHKKIKASSSTGGPPNRPPPSPPVSPPLTKRHELNSISGNSISDDLKRGSPMASDGGSDSDTDSGSTSDSESEHEREERRKRRERILAEKAAAKAINAIKERENMVAKLEGEIEVKQVAELGQQISSKELLHEGDAEGPWFALNGDKKKSYMSYVRGKILRYDPDSINKFLHTEWASEWCQFALSMDEGVDFDDVERTFPASTSTHPPRVHKRGPPPAHEPPQDALPFQMKNMYMSLMKSRMQALHRGQVATTEIIIGLCDTPPSRQWTTDEFNTIVGWPEDQAQASGARATEASVMEDDDDYEDGEEEEEDYDEEED